MNLCFVINHNYVEKLLVTLYSCYLNNSFEKIHAYIIQKDLTSFDKSRIEVFFTRYNVEIDFYDVDDKLFMNASHMATDKVSYTTYYKLYILKLLNKLDRVLYLDCDIIVDGDITQFYYQKMNKFMGVVKDNEIIKSNKNYIKKITGSRKNNYFNAGVILFNFYEGYEYDIPSMDEIVEFLNTKSSNLKMHDQDIFNHFFKDNLQFFEEKYNYFAIYHHLYQLLLPIPNKFNPTIIHYVGLKPWQKGYVGFFKKKYIYYYNKVNEVYNINFLEKNSLKYKTKYYVIICRTKIHRFVNWVLKK